MKIEIEDRNGRREFEITLYGVTGRLYENSKDVWSMECGGFYNWNTDLKDALERTNTALYNVAKNRAELRLKEVTKELKRQGIIGKPS